MALGQNEQFFYSPDVRIFINSLTQSGIIEVSDDFMSLTIERNINGVSTASIYLANNGFKYTPASFNFTGSNVPSPIINTMDEVIIFLKKESYYQYFTGFVTYAPIVTLIPEPILINCSCTLYKAQNSFWDAGAIEYEGILPGILQNAQIFGGNVQNTDGGVKTGMTNLLTKVANWSAADIHIGGIPSQWVSFATNIYKQTQIQLKDQNATSFQDIINYLEVTGGTSKDITSTTTQGRTGVGDGTVASLGVPRAPEGTALLNITSGVTITATYASISDLSNNAGADNIVKKDSSIQYWIAVPFTYWAAPLKKKNTGNAKSWLQGALTPDIYPSIAQVGRLLLLTNTINGRQVQVHVVYAIKTKLINGADIVLSEEAFTYLNGGHLSSSPPNSLYSGVINILDKISVDAWVNPSNGNLKGGPVVKHVTPKSKPKSKSKSKTDSTLPYPIPTNTEEWAKDLLTILDAPLSDFNVGYIMAWEHLESPSGFGYNPLGDETYANGAVHAPGNTASVWAYQSWLSGLNTIAYNLTSLPQNAGIVSALRNGNAGFHALSVAQAQGGWDGGGERAINALGTSTDFYYGGINGLKLKENGIARLPGDGLYTTPSNSGSNPNASTPGLNNTVGNFNFNTTQGVVGFDVNSTILAGSPRAFVTDVPVLSTLGTLATMGLREFQSGPDGSFLAWYPDYFGLYGTAPVLSIYDIEIINFSIYHDDTQLYTHIGVSGDPTEIGDVSLVDWLMTNGIVTIENNAILGLLFGSDPATMSTNMNSLLSQGINVNTFAKQFLRRYGMRPYVDSEPMIRSQLMEFMYALQEFLYLWSQQYATNVTFTFMPELYPGMLIEIAEHGLQVYVQSVSQSCSRDGGFTTNAVVTCPTRVIGTKTVNGKKVKNVVPVDFGYPIQLQNG